MEWIDFKENPPTKEHSYCWVMNCRRGAYGFVALWYHDSQYFGTESNDFRTIMALDVTHYYPLPMPFYKKDEHKDIIESLFMSQGFEKNIYYPKDF